MSYNIWRSVIQPVKDGEPVDQQTTNRAIAALVERTEYLKSRVEGLDPSSGRLTYSNAVTPSDVAEGDWVYFNETTQKFEKALAEMVWDDTLKALMPSPRSFVVGLVIQKLTPTTAVIFLRGTGIVLTEQPNISSMADLLQANETTFVPGRYFLSSTTPGKMTAVPTCAPLISLGTFGESTSTIDSNLKEVFEAHLHHRFFLFSKPGSSQSGGPGWASRDSGGAYDTAFVNYSYDDECLIQLSVRHNPAFALPSVRARVDLTRTSLNKLRVKIYEDPAQDNPLDTTTTVLSNDVLEWPDYGEEIAIGDEAGLHLLIAFIRVDYENETRHEYATLAEDITSGAYVAVDAGWKLYTPVDLQGWTNANPVDTRTPSGVYFRYMVEGHLDLYSMFPPVPAEGMALYEGGSLKNPNGYSVDYFGIWWKGNVDKGDATSTFPWAWNYDAETTPPTTTPKDLVLTLSTNPVGPVESVVKCLVSKSEFLQIQRLDGSDRASTGLLQMLLNLNLAVGTQTPSDEGSCLGGINADGNRFLLGNKVARLVPGPNIRLAKVDAEGNEVSLTPPFTGLIKVEAVLPELSGGATSFTLFNAKESERNGVIYTEFLVPTVAKTKAVARISIPNFDRGTNNIRLRLFAKFLGETTLSTDAKLGIFKVEYRIVRAGVNVATTLTSPIRVEGWQVDFPIEYPQFKLLDNELPVYGAAGTETFKKQPATSIYDLYANNLIEPNDTVFVSIERVTNSSPFLIGDASSLSSNTLGTDNYAGSIGLVDLRWTITLS